MTPKKIIPIALISLFIITSCGKESSPTSTTIKKAPVVYITGICRSGANAEALAVYWKDGVRTALVDSTGSNNSVATGIVVSGTDVYISGAVNTIATYWKNGKATAVSGLRSYANAIAVNGSDIYMAGFSTYNGNIEPTYWKNGNAVILNDGGGSTIADGIAISGSDVYVAGHTQTASGATIIVYWKNGTLVTGANSPSGSATYYLDTYYNGWVNIAVSGSDVYLTGTTSGFTEATYSKNGVSVPILINPTEQSVANNIALNGNDVYVAGSYYFAATYWKNGTMTTLSGGAQPNSMATAIAINGSDVYIAGCEGASTTTFTGALYWKNDIVTTLPGNTSATTGIALVQN